MKSGRCLQPANGGEDGQRNAHDLFYAERKQHVAGASAERAITGVDVEHSARDGSAGALHRTTLGRHSVHGLEFAIGIEFPENRAVFGGMGTERPC